jgi:hypothetical protein
MTLDSTGFAAGDTNLYRYVGNAPTNFTDPSGEQFGLGWGDYSGGMLKWYIDDTPPEIARVAIAKQFRGLIPVINNLSGQLRRLQGPKQPPPVVRLRLQVTTQFIQAIEMQESLRHAFIASYTGFFSRSARPEWS